MTTDTEKEAELSNQIQIPTAEDLATERVQPIDSAVRAATAATAVLAEFGDAMEGNVLVKTLSHFGIDRVAAIAGIRGLIAQRSIALASDGKLRLGN